MIIRAFFQKKSYTIHMNIPLIERLKKESVDILAVSKYHTKEEIDALAKLGFTTFGENRVQEFLEKYDPNYHWHIIGHLQTNKVKYIIGKVDCIQSLDSIRLADEIEKQAAKHDCIQNVLVQIKVSNDPNKTGLPIEDLPTFLSTVSSYPHICIKGLMCIASHTEDTQAIEEEFELVHQSFETYKKEYPTMDTLSMGMSSDYELAIQHGSTMVRIGRALFE